MNIIKELSELLSKYKFNFQNINLNESLDVIIDNVENIITLKYQNIQNQRILISELLHLKRKYEIYKLVNNEQFQEFEKQLKNEINYIRTNSEIIIDKLIQIESVSYITNLNIYQTVILNDKQKQDIGNIGYYISNINIPLFETLKIVNCCGKHSNLNPNTHEYCLNSSFINQSFSFELIMDIIKSMSHMSLDDTYLSYNQLLDIFKII